MADRDASPTRVPARAAKKKPTHASPPPKVNLSVQDRRHKTRLLNETQRRKDQLLGLTTYDVATHLHRYTVEPSVMMDESREGCTMAAASKSTQLAAVEVPGATTHSSTLNGAAAAPSSRLAGAAAMAEGDANTRWHTQYAQHLQHKKTATEHPPSVSAAASSPFLRLRDTAGGGATSDDDEGETDGEALPLPPSTFEEWMAAGCPTGSWAALLEEEVYAPVAAERALLAAKYDPKGRGPPPAP